MIVAPQTIRHKGGTIHLHYDTVTKSRVIRAQVPGIAPQECRTLYQAKLWITRNMPANKLAANITAALKQRGYLPLATSLRNERPVFRSPYSEFIRANAAWRNRVAEAASRVEDQTAGAIPASTFAGFVLNP